MLYTPTISADEYYGAFDDAPDSWEDGCRDGCLDGYYDI